MSDAAAAVVAEETMNDNKPVRFDYKTHILIGCTADARMTVVCYWPNLPRQAEVEQAIRLSKEGHAAFLLCTPTSVLPVTANGQQEQQSSARLK
jgi:hypothetical protein